MAIIQEHRQVSNFDEVHVEMSGDIFLKQGETEELIIEADSELLPRLKSDVNLGRLELGLRHWYDFMLLIPNPSIRYYLTMKNIRGITISGSGKLEAEHIQTDRIRMKLSGSGEFNIVDLQATDLEISFSGSGKANLSGSVKRQELDVSGSGDYRAEELDSQEMRVHISGSASARVRVQKRLEVSISGSGEVRYHGQPEIEHRISGSGSIRAF